MDVTIRSAIAEFFASVARLRELGIVRSDKHLGDLGEFICKHFYSLELAASGRQVGHDGHDSDGRVQVKYHGSCTRTNINLGDPNAYENLLVVLGPNSLLRSPRFTGDFLVYRMSADLVRQHRKGNTNTFSCGKAPFDRAPDQVLNLNDQAAAVAGAGQVMANPSVKGTSCTEAQAAPYVER